LIKKIKKNAPSALIILHGKEGRKRGKLSLSQQEAGQQQLDKAQGKGRTPAAIPMQPREREY